MRNLLLITASTLLTTGAVAQKKINYKPSGEVLQSIYDAVEDEKYGQVIEKGAKIHEGDTNYMDIQFEMAHAYFKDLNYDEAIKICNLHIKEQHELTHLFYLYLGRSYLEKKQYEIAIDVFSQAIDLYPKYAYLYKRRSEANLELKNYEEGIKDLQMAIKLNPWDAENHLKLGELAEAEGEFTKAFMCYISNIILKPDDNLKLLSEVNEKLDQGFDEMPLNITISEDDYSSYDDLINDKAAMSKDVKTKSDLSLPIIKNCQFIFDKMAERELGDGFFDTFYAPFFKELQAQPKKTRRNFDYVILFSSENSQIVQKVNANRYNVINYYKNTLMPLWLEEHSKYTEEFNGKVQDVKYLWSRQKVYSIGVQKDDHPTGFTQYFYENGMMQATGNYDDEGNRDGEWVFYFYNGKVSRVKHYKEDEETGVDSSFYDNGVVRFVDVINDEDKTSVLSRYNYYGVPSSVITYKDDERNGPATFYNSFGTEKYNVAYVEGDLEGEFIEYYDNKQIAVQVNYIKDERDGLRKTYYKNGQLKSEGTYVEGELEGELKTYFVNGNLKSEATYKEGVQINQTKTYHINGSLSSEGFYDEKGKKNGIYKEYDRAGKLNLEFTYKKGNLVAYKVYHKDGTLLKEGKKKGGEFLFENFYSDGTRRAVGNYVGEDGKTGLWKFYDRNGTLDEEETYNNGQLNGKNTSFYYNGKKHFTANYQSGKANGRYVRYYLNGQISRQGYYIEGDAEGNWIYYNSNGTVSAEKFFVNDELNGPQRFYDVAEKLTTVEYYDNGTLTHFEKYDTNGTVLKTYHISKESTLTKIVGIDGNVVNEYTRVNGIFHGTSTIFYGNGEVKTTGEYVEGNRHGKWTGNHANGKLRFTGEYFYGSRIGEWKYYDDEGNISSETPYEYGNIHGVDKSYVNGILTVERPYDRGSAHGDAKYYSEKGELQMVRRYYHGKAIAYSYPNSTGDLVDFIELENESCECKTYFGNGTISREFTMTKGYFDGEYKEYFENGQLNNIDIYSGGNKNGTTNNYYPSGKLRFTVNYVDNKKEGDLVYYHENGQIAEVIPYVNGVLHGEYKKYSSDGKLIESYTYYDGDMIK